MIIKPKKYRTKNRPIRVDGVLAFIPLTQGLEAIIDAEDIHLVENFNWNGYLHRYTAYARTTSYGENGERNVHPLHRVILDAPESMRVDHINGDGLDNRKSNLRLASTFQNAQNARRRKDNTSGYKGVKWESRYFTWVARIKVEGRRFYLGAFPTAELAAQAYNDASEKYHGEFANPTIDHLGAEGRTFIKTPMVN